MSQTHELAPTTWRQGAFRVLPRQLVFGQTYEDPCIELQVIRPESRVFCIAGAGYTARVLAAAGHRITAVDINASQIGYARALNDGGLPHAGIAEQVLRVGRKLTALCGWTRQKLEVFLNLSQCSEQVEYWDRELDTPMLRAAFNTLLAPRLLRMCYRGPFVASLPADFGPQIRQRLRRGWASHSNRSNPFAALLLLGKPIPDAHPAALPIRFARADAADYLEGCAPGSFDAFALSNIGDGASPEYQRRLSAAIVHAGSPQAVVVWRSFAETGNDVGTNRATADRSLLWGTVKACQLSVMRNGGPSCFIC
jgi:S-adenosylmethionine:diacylglycerol 3-amino-3-carboxypropyl transferase